MTAAGLEAATTVRACVFTLGGDAFAVAIGRVREIVVFDGATAVPRAPAHVLGVANLRGDVVTVVDPAAQLGLAPRTLGRQWRTLVVAGRMAVGLVIDDVLGLETFDEVLSPGEAGRRRYGALAAGLLRRMDRLVTLLDVDRLITALRGEG